MTSNGLEDETSVRVAVRVRPQIAREIIDCCRICTSVTPGEPQVWLGSDAFTYDYVYDVDSSQERIYDDCVSHLVEGTLDGYNATVLAYGQTGSGKTYTMGTGFDMSSGVDQVGIIPRAVNHLFEKISQEKESATARGIPIPDFKVEAQFLELYNEEVFDLLNPSNRRLGRQTGFRIREDPATGAIQVSGVTRRPIRTPEEALACLKNGALGRTTASTEMNSQSSRSHAIFTIHVAQQRIASPEAPMDVDGDNAPPPSMPDLETLTAKFHFVDLAGSERLKRTGATGDRAKEGISINCGLLALGNVISALGDVTKKGSHVPYRDSKLTRLLQDSLGGNSKTLMIACVSPSDCDFMESRNTMKYANRARNIKNKVTVNQDKTSKTLAMFKMKIQQLELELMEFKTGKRVVSADGEEGMNDMYHEITMLQSENDNLRVRVKAMEQAVEEIKKRNQQLLIEKNEGLFRGIRSRAPPDHAEGEGGGGEDSDGLNDVSEMISQYLTENEELRSKLMEAEATCAQLRKQALRRGISSVEASPFVHSSLMSTGPGRSVTHSASESLLMDQEGPCDVDEILEMARRELENEKALLVRKQSLDGTEKDEEEEDEEEDEDSSDSDNNKENIAILESEKDLATLSENLARKQQMIEALEMSQRRFEAMKAQYEDKLRQLGMQIQKTEMERDKIIASIKGQSSDSEDKVKKVKTEYEKKLSKLQREVKDLQRAKKEHSKMLKENSEFQRNFQKAKSELEEMKATKVRLMRKIKEEVAKAKQNEQIRIREVAALKKTARAQESKISRLVSEKEKTRNILTRRTEEVTNLRKFVKEGKLSKKAAGRFHQIGQGTTKAQARALFSPKVAKNKWTGLEEKITTVSVHKASLFKIESMMQRDLEARELRIREKEALMERLQEEKQKGSDEETVANLEDQIESIQANVDWLSSNLRDHQQNISELDSGWLSVEIDPDPYIDDLGIEEIKYVLQKLINMAISKSVVAEQKINDLNAKEEQLKKIQSDQYIQKHLFEHVIQKTGLIDVEDAEPMDDASAPAICPSAESSGAAVKARQRPTGPEDALYGSNTSLGSGSSSNSSKRRLTYRPHDSQELLLPGVETARSGFLQKIESILEGEGEASTPTESSGNHEGTGPLQTQISLQPPPSPTLPYRNRNIGLNMTSPSHDPSASPPAPKRKAAPNPSPSLVRKPFGPHSTVLVKPQVPPFDIPPPPASLPLAQSLFFEKGLPPPPPSLSRQGSTLSSSGDSNETCTLSMASLATYTTEASSQSETGTSRSRGNNLNNNNVFSRLTGARDEEDPYKRGTMKPPTVSATGTGVGLKVRGKSSSSIRQPLICVLEAEGHGAAVVSLCATSSRLFTGSRDRTVKVWDLETSEEIAILSGHPGSVSRVRTFPNDPTAAILFSVSANVIRIWDLRSPTVTGPIKTLNSAGMEVSDSSSATSVNHPVTQRLENDINDLCVPSQTLFFSTAANQVRIWDTRTFSPVGKLIGNTNGVVLSCLAAETKGVDGPTSIVTGAKDHYVKMYDVSLSSNQSVFSPKATLTPPHYDGVTCLALDGDILFSGSRDKAIKKWNLKREKQEKTMVAAHNDYIHGLCFGPGGNRDILISCCRSGVVKTWNTRTCQETGSVAVAPAHTTINDITCNDSLIFTALEDGRSMIWKPKIF